MNRTLKTVTALMLMMVLAASCNKKQEEPQTQVPLGAVDGLFSVSENKQVYFSQGNLQYQPLMGLWQFASNQYDFLERDDNVEIDENYNQWIDVFAWGTSGINHGAVCYQPWSNSLNDGDYYAYGDSLCDLHDKTGQADWGYNAISNGGNQTGQWRTLTNEEWEYVFDKRSTPSGSRFVASSKVHGAFGVILFPDDWDNSIYPFTQINEKRVLNFATANVIKDEDWNALHYQYGLVFLPYYNRAGIYWSSSCYDNYNDYDIDCAYDLTFAAGQLFLGKRDDRHRKNFVRLVQDAQ